MSFEDLKIEAWVKAGTDYPEGGVEHHIKLCIDDELLKELRSEETLPRFRLTSRGHAYLGQSSRSLETSYGRMG